MNERNYATEAVLLKGVGIFCAIIGFIVLAAMIFVKESEAVTVGLVFGCIFLTIGIAFVLWGKGIKDKYIVNSEELVEGKKNAKKWITTFLLIFIPVFAVLLIVVVTSIDNNKPMEKCEFCGNFETLAGSGLCENCEKNYLDMKKFIEENKN